MFPAHVPQYKCGRAQNTTVRVWAAFTLSVRQQPPQPPRHQRNMSLPCRPLVHLALIFALTHSLLITRAQEAGRAPRGPQASREDVLLAFSSAIVYILCGISGTVLLSSLLVACK
jgi:hypothetical protein